MHSRTIVSMEDILNIEEATDLSSTYKLSLFWSKISSNVDWLGLS